MQITETNKEQSDENAKLRITEQGSGTENLTDITTGLQYIIYVGGYLDYAKPYEYGYEIGDLKVVKGKEAYEVWTINPTNNKRIQLYTYLHIDGLKVSMSGRDKRHRNTWLPLYDFGLQPGEIMVGYSYFVASEPTKFFYRCISIEDNEKYNGLKLMTLEWSDSPDFPNHDNRSNSTTWIMNYGGPRNLLGPTIGYWAGLSGEAVREIRIGKVKIFSLF